MIVVTAGLIYLFTPNCKENWRRWKIKSGLRIVATAPEGTSFEAMDAYQRMLLEMVDTMPEKRFMLGITAPAFGSSTSVNSSFVRISLKLPDERKKSQMALASDLNRQLRQHTFAQAFVVQEPTISASRGGRGGLPIQFVLQAPDLDRLKEAIPRFMEKAQADPTFDVVTIDLRFNKPEYTVEINRTKALDMGVSVQDIAQSLQAYLSEQRMGYFIRDGKQYYVLVSARKEDRNEPLDLSRLTVRNASGEMVSLDNLVSLHLESRPPQLLRYNRFVAATVSAAPAQGKTIGDGIEAMERIADEVLDDSFSTPWQEALPTTVKALATS